MFREELSTQSNAQWRSVNWTVWFSHLHNLFIQNNPAPMHRNDQTLCIQHWDTKTKILRLNKSTIFLHGLQTVSRAHFCIFNSVSQQDIMVSLIRSKSLLCCWRNSVNSWCARSVSASSFWSNLQSSTKFSCMRICQRPNSENTEKAVFLTAKHLLVHLQAAWGVHASRSGDQAAAKRRGARKGEEWVEIPFRSYAGVCFLLLK
jgi:hypothetical protein